MNKAVYCRNEAISIDSNQWNLMHFGNNLIHLFISFEARGDSATFPNMISIRNELNRF